MVHVEDQIQCEHETVHDSQTEIFAGLGFDLRTLGKLYLEVQLSEYHCNYDLKALQEIESKYCCSCFNCSS